MGCDGISQRAALIGTAPTHKAVGRVFFVVRRTMATGYLQTAAYIHVYRLAAIP
jgi:hypothetical protein